MIKTSQSNELIAKFSKSPMMCYMDKYSVTQIKSLQDVVNKCRIIRALGKDNINYGFLDNDTKSIEILKKFQIEVKESPQHLISLIQAICEPTSPQEIPFQMDQCYKLQTCCRLMEVINQLKEWSQFVVQYLKEENVINIIILSDIFQIGEQLQHLSNDLRKFQNKVIATKFQNDEIEDFVIDLHQNNNNFNEDIIENQSSMTVQIEENKYQGQELHPNKELLKYFSLPELEQLAFIQKQNKRIQTLNNIKEMYNEVILQMQLQEFVKLEPLKVDINWVCHVELRIRTKISPKQDQQESYKYTIGYERNKNKSLIIAQISVLEIIAPIILVEVYKIYNLDKSNLVEKEGKILPEKFPTKLEKCQYILDEQQQQKVKKRSQQQLVMDEILTEIQKEENNFILNIRLCSEKTQLLQLNETQRRRLRTLLNRILEFYKAFLKDKNLKFSIGYEDQIMIAKIQYDKDNTQQEITYNVKDEDITRSKIQGYAMFLNIYYKPSQLFILNVVVKYLLEMTALKVEELVNQTLQLIK